MRDDLWTPENEARLVELANGEIPHSLKQLGLILGVTRSTIAGKVLRFKARGVIADDARGLMKRPKREKKRKPKPRRKKEMPPERDRALRDYPKKLDETAERQAPTPGRPSGTAVGFQEQAAPSMEMRRVRFLKLAPGQCRFPLGDVGDPDFCFCGNDAPGGQSYCPLHHGYTRRRTG